MSKFLIIKGTDEGYIIPMECENAHELRRWATLFRKDIFDKVDTFVSDSKPGDTLKLDNIYFIVNWSGNGEEIK